MLLAGAGFMLIIAREHDQRINTLLTRRLPLIHDFIGLVLIFLRASCLTLLPPRRVEHDGSPGDPHHLLHVDQPAWGAWVGIIFIS